LEALTTTVTYIGRGAMSTRRHCTSHTGRTYRVSVIISCAVNTNIIAATLNAVANVAKIAISVRW